ncbi:unnamed protein product [Dimorphilus gyrociliatus]|uniref:Uncharacterized protein n=1 Tax=Dimorphilus gyrociliatus TaxID=2664684 RepID=A0A7I8VZP9_9ANNE|nr:unnamed protein product [Dimorphilus gyrociliatus]
MGALKSKFFKIAKRSRKTNSESTCQRSESIERSSEKFSLKIFKKLKHPNCTTTTVVRGVPHMIRQFEVSIDDSEDDSLTGLVTTHFRVDVTPIVVEFNSKTNGPVHTQIDYVHCLVPDLLDITNCPYYWGDMDRYEAEKELLSKPEGTFLLRDSAQEDFLFSVSFRRYCRTLHARIEQFDHHFSFDSLDSGVYQSKTVCGLVEHYKDPECCMFFEPMLTVPLFRQNPFSLCHLARAAIVNCMKYVDIQHLPLPAKLREYLKYYHYKQKMKVHRLDKEFEGIDEAARCVRYVDKI